MLNGTLYFYFDKRVKKMSVKELKTDEMGAVMCGKVFLEFYSPECAYCRATEPTVNKLSEKFTDVDFYKVNTRTNESLTHSCNIRSLPTFIVFSDGKEIGRAFGAKSEKELTSLISLF